MKIHTCNSYLISFVFVCFLIATGGLYAQRVDAVTLSFKDACVSDSHYQFSISFKWVPPLPNAANQYIIELSDGSGDFSNATVLTTITGKNTIYELSTLVEFPKTVAGDNYKIRVSSTNPSSSAESESFSAYYVSVSTPMRLNNGVSSVLLCPGHTKEISLNITNANKYKWYRNNVLIPNQTKSSLVVSEEGEYYATVDYGTFCSGSSGSRSNNVNVSVGQKLGVTISGSSADGYICKGDTFTIQASIQNPQYTYKWYRNDQLVKQGVGESSFSTTEEGTYFLDLVVPNTQCEERTNAIEVKYRENFKVNVAVNDGSGELLLPGETKELKVTTTAENPTYQWFLDGNPISGATAALHQASQAGEYTVRVVQGGTCPGVAVVSEKLKIKKPKNFEVTIGYKSSSYADCLYDKTSLVVKKISALIGDNNEKIDLKPSNYSAFSYQWLKGNTPLPNNHSELLVDNPSYNGVYSLKISAPTYLSIPNSNQLSVKLADPDALKLLNPSGQEEGVEFCEGEKVTLSVSIQHLGANYIWYKNNVKIDEGVDKHSLEVSETGAYHVSLSSFDDFCPAISNVIYAEKVQESANWAEAYKPQQVFINGKRYPPLQISHNLKGTISVKWYRNGVEIPGLSATSYSVTQPGAYYAVVKSVGGGCSNNVFTLPIIRYVEINNLKVTIGFKSQQNQDCDGTATQANLAIQRLDGVLLDSENILIEPRDYQYFDFQWRKDGNPIANQTNASDLLVLKENDDASDYTLRASYGTIIGISNALSGLFASVPEVKIQTQDGNKMAKICEGGSVKLVSTVVAPSYSYQWYKGVEKIEGAVEPVYEATEIGAYLLEISSGACSKKSIEAITVSNFDPNQVKITYVINPQIQVNHGSVISTSKGLELKVEGGNPNGYLWQNPSNSVIASTIKLNESGVYTLTATIGGTCSPVVISFKANVTEVKEIPNVVTPNGDGHNDYWQIPEDYLNKPNVRVIIYSQEGKVVFNQTNYDNQSWPNLNTFKDLGRRALLFLYVIEVDNRVDKQGVITLIR